MSGHTPGPWVVVAENDGEGPIEVRAPPYIVARVFSDPATYTITNANLIAAAPALLAELRQQLEEIEELSHNVQPAIGVARLRLEGTDFDEAFGARAVAAIDRLLARSKVIRAAIAKAEGRQP